MRARWLAAVALLVLIDACQPGTGQVGQQGRCYESDVYKMSKSRGQKRHNRAMRAMLSLHLDAPLNLADNEVRLSQNLLDAELPSIDLPLVRHVEVNVMQPITAHREPLPLPNATRLREEHKIVRLIYLSRVGMLSVVV